MEKIVFIDDTELEILDQEIKEKWKNLQDIDLEDENILNTQS